MRNVSVAAALLLAASAGQATAQDDIDDAREMQLDNVESQLRLDAQIDDLDATYADVVAALQAAQQLVTRQEDKIAAAQFELDAARLRLAQIENRIEWTTYDLAALDERITRAAVEAYVGRGGTDETATVLGSNDLNEGVTRIALLQDVTNTSEDVLDLARVAQLELDSLQTDAAETVMAIEAVQAQLEAHLDTLASDRDRASELEDTVALIREEWRERRGELEDEEDRLERFIANATAVEQGRSPDLANVSADGYVWPTAGALHSGFGSRLHPILGYYRMHSGLDIGGEQGQPIYAATGGEVILAGVNGGYGNTIVIDHGDGLSTLYAHQTSFESAVGDVVDTGDIIGYVGSTGMSTGPHLHFEVRLFGSPIDPLPFLPAR